MCVCTYLFNLPLNPVNSHAFSVSATSGNLTQSNNIPHIFCICVPNWAFSKLYFFVSSREISKYHQTWIFIEGFSCETAKVLEYLCSLPANEKLQLCFRSYVSIFSHRMWKGFSRISRTENLVNSHWHDMTVIIQLEIPSSSDSEKYIKGVKSRDKNRIQSPTRKRENWLVCFLCDSDSLSLTASHQSQKQNDSSRTIFFCRVSSFVLWTLCLETIYSWFHAFPVWLLLIL